MLTVVLLTITSILTFVSVWPYMYDIVRGRTKPRIVSWLNWSLLTGIAAFASLSAHEYTSAVVTGASSLETIGVAILAIRCGDKKIERLDVLCQIGAVVGLVLWFAFDSPLIALYATLIIDFTVALPTYRHCWYRPWEETPSAYYLCATGFFLAIFTVHNHTLAGYAFPVYLFLANSIMTSVLYLSPHRRKS
jgi:hypothetical protein